MLEIKDKHIQELNDTDLRILIGRLCEAELQLANLPISGITYSGNQDAKDGGLDVRVELENAIPINGFIPIFPTGFQVKKPKMQPAQIKKEMRPKGVLRQVIRELAKKEGAYIIVSGSASVADLTERLNSMTEALFDLDNASNLKLDFYDSGRIASWVRCHPSIILWVRDKIGNPIHGWRPFGNWSNAPEGMEDFFLSNEVNHTRLNKGTEAMSMIEGINSLRKDLSKAGSAVRLVGLSGVGKTRLLQALFDENLGDNSLNKHQVCYTDTGFNPIPNPCHFAEKLIASNKSSVLAVDNCSFKLHRNLSQLCEGSMVSLVTIEYDIREDEPERTEVYRLGPASSTLIETLLIKRFKELNGVNARKITDFAGGNARIAFALAETVRKRDSLVHLSDEELFKRLFWQNHEPDLQLLKSAEVCSLVYSFNFKNLELELEILASLIDKTSKDIFRDTSILKKRDLVQERGIYRAILPHAIANRLAKDALEKIPVDEILNTFKQSSSERLLQSFARRLGYLHESKEAVEIAKKWLSEGGLLGDVSDLNMNGITLFKNIAPTSPKDTLAAIERAATSGRGNIFSKAYGHYHPNFASLLYSLAYDPVLFERSVALLCRFTLLEDKKEDYNSAKNFLRPLFFMEFSGTNATVNQRHDIINKLVYSDFEEEQGLGLLLLDSALTTQYNISHNNFDFGAHSRDYGYTPKTDEEKYQWFGIFIELASELALSEQPISIKAKRLLADRFRNIWIKGYALDALVRAAKSIIQKRPWEEIWIQIKNMIVDAKKLDHGNLKQLLELEKMAMPCDLLQQVRAYLFSDYGDVFNIINEGNSEKEGDEKVIEVIRTLGIDVARNEAVFRALLPEIVVKIPNNYGPGITSFAQGLAEGSKDHLAMWKDFYNYLSKVETKRQNYLLLCDFLSRAFQINRDFCEQILDDAIEDEVLCVYFPQLQSSVEIDNRGIERLQHSLAKNFTPIWAYQSLAMGRVHQTINDEDLSDLLRMIASKPNGWVIAMEILYMRLYAQKNNKHGITDFIFLLGKELLAQTTFDNGSGNHDRIDYRLSEIAKAVLIGDDSTSIAKTLCENLCAAVNGQKAHFQQYSVFLEYLAQKHPILFLDSFLNTDDTPKKRTLLDDVGLSEKLLSFIPDEFIIRWCQAAPLIRFPIIASLDTLYGWDQVVGTKWAPLALSIIKECPDKKRILTIFERLFHPTWWSGDLSDVLQERIPLLVQFKVHPDKLVSDWASALEPRVMEMIKSERESEKERPGYLSFE